MGDVEDIGILEHRHGGGVAELADDAAQLGLDEFLDVGRLQIGRAGGENPGAQDEAPVDEAHIAERHEGVQAASGGRRRHAGLAGDIGKGHGRALLAERRSSSGCRSWSGDRA
jgi:hypothetical protein